MTLKIRQFQSLLSLLFLTSIFSVSGCQLENASKVNSANTLPLNEVKYDSDSAPKNIIIFIGDGMGISTITAGRIFDGQSKGLKGEAHSLAFEDFDTLALIKTYNTNAQVPDSAGTATAILSGYKTNIGAVNVRPNESVTKMVVESCVLKNSPPTLTERAKTAGLSVGIISTARITHATPAAMYGHSVDRGWEADADLDPRAAKARCKGLASQLLEAPFDISLGGGREKFTPEQLIAWDVKPGHIYVKDAAGFRNAPKDKTLLGLFTPSHMSYEADRDNALEPSLAEMTGVAIDALTPRDTGYVLMVEAGRVDHAHHDTNAFRALTDMQALNEAVKIAKEKAGDDTLILVTADHSHVFTMGGYPVRGNPILGLVRNPDPEEGGAAKEYAKANDGKPYTTLGYHNGPNVRDANSPVLTDNSVQAADFRQQSAVGLSDETHGGEDVALFATGPSANRFSGVMEQNEIGEIIGELIAK